MFEYEKAAPTTYVMHFSGGRIRRQGTGLAFLGAAGKTAMADGVYAKRRMVNEKE